MPGLEFHETRRGAKFYDADVPRIAEALEMIGAELKRANDLEEEARKPRIEVDSGPFNPKVVPLNNEIEEIPGDIT